jgi:hypothetical protein
MSVGSRKPSLFALISPRLWTGLNQYGAEAACGTGLYELLLSMKFEVLLPTNHGKCTRGIAAQALATCLCAYLGCI